MRQELFTHALYALSTVNNSPLVIQHQQVAVVDISPQGIQQSLVGCGVLAIFQNLSLSQGNGGFLQRQINGIQRPLQPLGQGAAEVGIGTQLVVPMLLAHGPHRMNEQRTNPQRDNQRQPSNAM